MISANFAAIISATGAMLSGFFALWSFFNERKIKAELKAGEKLFFGRAHHPSSVALKERRECVLKISVHNVSTSKRAFITDLQAFDRKGESVDISWSRTSDSIGSIPEQGGILMVEDFEDVYLRVNDGESLNYLLVKIFHTFSKNAEVVVFDRYADTF